MNLPKSWEEITIKTWQELNSVQSDSELTVLIERISILLDKDPEEIRQLDIKSFNKLTEQLSWLGSDLPNKINLKIEIEGKKYGMIPDLNFISTGEFVDIENWKNNSIENIHLIAAVLWRPIISEDGDEYLISKHKPEGFMKRADLFLNHLKITEIWGAILFFSTIGMEFIEIMQDYLVEEEKASMKKTKKTSTRSATKKNK